MADARPSAQPAAGGIGVLDLPAAVLHAILGSLDPDSLISFKLSCRSAARAVRSSTQQVVLSNDPKRRRDLGAAVADLALYDGIKHLEIDNMRAKKPGLRQLTAVLVKAKPALERRVTSCLAYGPEGGWPPWLGAPAGDDSDSDGGEEQQALFQVPFTTTLALCLPLLQAVDLRELAAGVGALLPLAGLPQLRSCSVEYVEDMCERGKRGHLSLDDFHLEIQDAARLSHLTSLSMAVDSDNLTIMCSDDHVPSLQLSALGAITGLKALSVCLSASEFSPDRYEPQLLGLPPGLISLQLCLGPRSWARPAGTDDVCGGTPWMMACLPQGLEQLTCLTRLEAGSVSPDGPLRLPFSMRSLVLHDVALADVPALCKLLSRGAAAEVQLQLVVEDEWPASVRQFKALRGLAGTGSLDLTLFCAHPDRRLQSLVDASALPHLAAVLRRLMLVAHAGSVGVHNNAVARACDGLGAQLLACRRLKMLDVKLSCTYQPPTARKLADAGPAGGDPSAGGSDNSNGGVDPPPPQPGRLLRDVLLQLPRLQDLRARCGEWWDKDVARRGALVRDGLAARTAAGLPSLRLATDLLSRTQARELQAVHAGCVIVGLNNDDGE